MDADMGEKAAMEQNIRRFSPSGEAPGSGLSVVKVQEKQPKPVLQLSPGLGGWLQQVSGSLCFTTDQTSRCFFLFTHEHAETMVQEGITALSPNRRAARESQHSVRGAGTVRHRLPTRHHLSLNLGLFQARSASLGAASASGKDFFRPIMTITGKGKIRPACHPINQR